MKLLANLDLNFNQLLNGVLQQLASDVSPAAGNKGQIFYNTTTNLVKVSNGATLDTITNVLEAITLGTANGLSVGAVSGKAQSISLALASGGAAGAMAAADFTKLGAATATATSSTLVMRDGSGNFSAGTITATLTGTASNATQLNSQLPSFYLDRANHTGTQLASTVSNFDTQVRTSRLDQMSAPTAAVAFNAQRITGVADPTSAQDAATKNYVDSVATGLDPKASVRVASTANVSVTYTATGGASARGQITAAPNTIDGITLVAGNRILLKNQTAGAQNGIWVVSTLGTGANGIWDRSTDFDQDVEVTAGAFMFVEEGTTNHTTSWVLSTVNPITIGGASGTSLTFTQFGAGSTYTNGNGISLTGNVFAVQVDTSVTNPNSLSVSANGVTISTTYVGQASLTTLGTITTGVWNGTAVDVAHGGTGSTTAAGARTNLAVPGKFTQLLSTSALTYGVTHGLGTLDIAVFLREVSTGALVYADYVAVSTTQVNVTFATAPSANAYQLIVIG